MRHFLLTTAAIAMLALVLMSPRALAEESRGVIIASGARCCSQLAWPMAEEMVREGKKARVIDLLFRGPFKFLKMYVIKGGFLEGRIGLLMAAVSAYYVFLKYAKLWEMKRSGRG